MNAEIENNASQEATEGQVAWTYVIYGLHALGAFGGLLSPAFVVTAFRAR